MRGVSSAISALPAPASAEKPEVNAVTEKIAACASTMAGALSGSTDDEDGAGDERKEAAEIAMEEEMTATYNAPANVATAAAADAAVDTDNSVPVELPGKPLAKLGCNCAL